MGKINERFDVDYWLDVLHWNSLTLDEQSQCALMELFRLADQMAPVGRDNRREFWITAKRGSAEEYRSYYDEDGSCYISAIFSQIFIEKNIGKELLKKINQ